MGADLPFQLGIQGTHLAQQLSLVLGFHRYGFCPQPDRVYSGLLLFTKSVQCLISTRTTARDNAETVTPELQQSLVRHPKTVAKLPEHLEQIVSRRLVIAIEIKQHIRVHHYERGPECLI